MMLMHQNSPCFQTNGGCGGHEAEGSQIKHNARRAQLALQELLTGHVLLNPSPPGNPPPLQATLPPSCPPPSNPTSRTTLH